MIRRGKRLQDSTRDRRVQLNELRVVLFRINEEDQSYGKDCREVITDRIKALEDSLQMNTQV